MNTTRFVILIWSHEFPLIGETKRKRFMLINILRSINNSISVCVFYPNLDATIIEREKNNKLICSLHIANLRLPQHLIQPFFWCTLGASVSCCFFNRFKTNYKITQAKLSKTKDLMFKKIGFGALYQNRKSILHCKFDILLLWNFIFPKHF